MKKKQNLNGFTLIEILVVIALLGVLGLILTNILTQVLRGQNKINTVNLVKQNGQVILDKLSSEIRSAENIICIGTALPNPGNRIVFYRKGNYTRIRFNNAGTVNGSFTREDFIKDDSIVIEQLCTEDINRGQNSLTDTDKDKGVSIDYDKPNGISKPIFEKQSQAGSSDLILIRFRAKTGVGINKSAENTVAEDGVLFTTAVSVRGGK